MAWHRVETPDTQQLVYRDGPALVVGPVLMLVGATLLLGTAQHLAGQWRDGAALGLGILVSGGIFALGVSLLTAREILIDRKAGQARRLARWLWLSKQTTHNLAGFEWVGWHRRGAHRTGAGYRVTLNGPAREPLELFEFILIDDARTRAAEVAAFLGWPCDHWDDKLLATATEREPASGTPAGAQALVWNLVGRQALRRVETTSPHRLVFRQSFETFLKVFGAFALPMGLLFLVSPWLGLEIGGGGDRLEPWAAAVIGGLFALLGVVFLLGRRGITFDRTARTTALWWGLPMPVWSRHYVLSAESRLTLSPAVRDAAGTPAVVWQVAAERSGAEPFTVFRSPVQAEARSLAEQAAEFLGCELRISS